jgi:hypothetical protein
MAIPIPKTQDEDLKEATFREQSSSHVQLQSNSLNMGRNTANTGCKSGNTADRSTFKKPQIWSNFNFQAFSSRHDFKSTYLSRTGFNTQTNQGYMHLRKKSQLTSPAKSTLRSYRKRNFVLNSFVTGARSQSNYD